MEDHISTAYDEALGEINSALVCMGGITITQLTCVFDALKDNPDGLDSLIAHDAKIDDFESRVNDMAVQLIATRAPVARDLRVVLSAIKSAQMLERIGDYACNIARRGKDFAAKKEAKEILGLIGTMGGVATAMLVDVVDALKHDDIEKAIAIWAGDVELDESCNAIIKTIVKKMDGGDIPARIGAQMIFTAKNIERIGDHTTGIAEQIYFRVKGSDIDGVRPKGAR